MKTWFLILGLALTAVAQENPRHDRLILVSRQVDVQFVENLALVKLQIKVKNPTEAPLEGDVAFNAPAGAAVFEASLLRHIASTERVGKLLHPDQAAAIYLADLRRQENREGEEAMRAMSGGLRPSNPTPVAPTPAPARPGFTPPTPTPATTVVIPPAGVRAPSSGVVLSTPANATIRNFNLRTPADPALLECLTGDRYRLRFYPVPPRDHQTVTVWMAFEVPKQGDRYAAAIPSGLDSNFETTAEARHSARISWNSSDPLKTVGCSSHVLKSIERDEDGRRISSRVTGEGDLALSYELGFWAKPHEFTAGGRPATAVNAVASSGFRAVLAKRALDRAEEPRRAALGLSSGIVSASGSFLIIEKNEARDLARTAERELRPDSGPAVPATDEQARECEFVRAAMKLPARSWAPRCEIYVVSTNDAAKLQWARDNGIVSGRSTGLLNGTSFEYVKHAAGCQVQEPNVEKLRQRAASLK